MKSPRSMMGSDDSVEKLKADIVALSRRAEVSDLELQTLRKQIVKERKKGQDLSREIVSLKEERDALKDECEKLKASRKRGDDLKIRRKYQFEGDPWTLLEEVKEELNYEKDLNTNLRLQLQKTQDSNAELILVVQDLEETLEKNNRGVSCLQKRSTASGESTVEIEESVMKCPIDDDDEEQRALEALVRQHSDAQETYLLEKKVMDLCSEIEMYRRDKDELEMQLEQLALEYEILKQENHEFSCRLEKSHLQEQLKMQYECSGPYAAINELEAQREKLENELKKQSKDLVDCLATRKRLEARNHSLEKELEKTIERFQTDIEARSCAKAEQEQRAVPAEEAFKQSNATINELKTQLELLKKELKRKLEDFSSSLATIKDLEVRNHDLEDELEKQAQGFEADLKALVHAQKEEEQRAIQADKAVARSNAKISELETRIKKLENKLKMRSKESSNTLATIKELKAHIQYLEEELEKQAEEFEADLEAVIHAKVEQEKRAIRAEESLRLKRWKNANIAARIQDEFKRLSSQTQSSFVANENLAKKALAEAGELCLQNRHLQEMLDKANEDLRSAKDEHEAKLKELYNEINMKSVQIEQIVLEIEGKSKLLENQEKHTDKVHESVLAEDFELRDRIERLIAENELLPEQAEQGENLKSKLEDMKARIKKSDLFVQMENMQSEVEALRAQCEKLKHSLCADELDKEKLRKQLFQLKADLKEKDEAISIIEKKSNKNSVRPVVQDRSRAASRNTKPEPMQHGTKEVATLNEKIKLLQGQIKSRETVFQTSANAFLEREKDLRGKIEELQIRLGEHSLSSSWFGKDQVKEAKVSVGMQVDYDTQAVTCAGEMPEEASKAPKI